MSVGTMTDRIPLSEIREYLGYVAERDGAADEPRRGKIERAVALARTERADAAAALVTARNEARDILDELENLASSLRRIIEGRGDALDSTTLRGQIAADGSLFAYGSRMEADWDTLLAHRGDPS